MPTQAIEGSCLCGAVRIAAPRVPAKVTQCNCSVCRRYGTLWAYFTRRAVSITAPRGGLVSYSVRRHGRRFEHCRTCGCVISWQAWARPKSARMALNARLFDPAAIAGVTIRVLDGDRTWQFVDEYRQPELFLSPVPRRARGSAGRRA